MTVSGASDIGKIRQLAPGVVLSAQGAIITTYAQIISGRVVASLFTTSGTRVWLDEYRPGDWIAGEMLDAGDAPCPYEVTAESHVEIMQFHAADLQRALTAQADLRARFDANMAAILRRRTHHLIQARTLSATGRICSELKRRSQPIGIELGQFIIRPTPIFSDVAFRAATTRESVSRLVSRLNQRGVITRKTGALVIADMARLEAQIK